MPSQKYVQVVVKIYPALRKIMSYIYVIVYVLIYKSTKAISTQ